MNRIHNLIRILAKRLLKSHKVQLKEDEIVKIVDYFTERLYSHQYFIGRKEAKEDLGIETVVDANDILSEAMTDLYEEYNKQLEFAKIWNPQNEIGPNAVQTVNDYKIAFIESRQMSNYYEITAEYRKQQLNVVQQTPHGPVQVPQEQVAVRIISQGWR